jgi:hypothetical protein
MDFRPAEKNPATQRAHHDPCPTRPHSKVTVAVFVLCAMVMTLLAPAATAATIAEANAGVRDQQAASAAPSGGKSGELSLLTAAPATVHGVAADGAVLDGSFKLKRFNERHGVLYAVGTLTGTLGDKSVKKSVSLPVTGASNELPAIDGLMQQQAPVPTPGACDILTLNLGPLDLDILGLRVALDPVNLLIETIPGAGNLLGNLLCGVAGLLDGPLSGGLGNLLRNLLDAVADLLNGLLG